MAIKLENHRIEYKVRPVTRFIVTRFEAYDDPDGGGTAGSDTKGEFDNFDTAYQVGYALCREEHRRLHWPLDDERIKYPEPASPPDGVAATKSLQVPPLMRVAQSKAPS